ncbi:MAG: UDP-N-acetylmuramate--L-alanine ligase, partial [Candidatus Hydrogenedentes bacterium]|nr:UDP-N-acetylmuramate--L-alanine ligase [Candidatus Hydrogenedentota bacterium]
QTRLPHDIGPIHFVGIGGIGMSGIAEVLLNHGYTVQGSDLKSGKITERLTQKGAKTFLGQKPENLDGAAVIVISSAIKPGNAELDAARLRGLPVVRRAEMLAELMRLKSNIAVGGTHGKTTTTGITAHVLEHAGLSPGFLVGGQPLNFEHSARLGAEGGPFIIEGDEYDTAFFDKRAKFFHYLPEVAVVTSLEFDHGDIYPDLAAIELAFQRMLRQIPSEGRLICCADNHAASLAEHAFCDVETYGFSDGADWRGEVLGIEEGRQLLRVCYRGEEYGEVATTLTGRHNLQNVLAAIAVANYFDVTAQRVCEGIDSFIGVRRRMETFLESEGITYIDDFAHHPTAIAETIAGAKTRWPGQRLRVLFEPRSNTTVTNRFFDDLRRAFSEADEVHLGPIYRTERIAEDERLDRERLVSLLRENGRTASIWEEPEYLAQHVYDTREDGDIVLILSNGAFGGIYDEFRRLTD